MSGATQPGASGGGSGEGEQDPLLQVLKMDGPTV